MTQIKPIGNRVVIKPAPSKEKTDSGIYIPDNAKEKPQKGEVVAVGDEVEKVQLAQNVLYGKYAGTEIDLDGETLLIMRESDIYAIV